MGKMRGGGGKGGGKKGGKKGGGKGGKKGGRKDKDWTHEGAGFGAIADEAASNPARHHQPRDDDHGDGQIVTPSSGPRKRRLTQAVQDQMRRGKLKAIHRSKERAVVRKFEAARLAAEDAFSPPPP
eukprot:evm.model.NODE_9938_length_23979_cov_25.075108.1